MEFKVCIMNSFGDIIEKYFLKIYEFSENEIVVFSNEYIFSFEKHASELVFTYIEKLKDGRLIQYYNFDSFIAFSADSDERENINKKAISGLEKQLLLYAKTIERKYDSLLKGEESWKDEYRNFILYNPPRDVTDIKYVTYKGKCI